MDLITDFTDLMNRGGPVMWVIFVTAWIALVLLVERGLQIRVWTRNAKQDQLGIHSDKTYQPSVLSGRRASPIALLLKRIKWGEVNTKDELSQQMNTHMAEIMPKLEGTLPTIAVIGSLLPMLGLLGTVTGMIQVFEVIALHGTGNPEEMAHGISQALLTTASGLIIAIPVIFVHHILVRRVRYVLALTEQSMLEIYNRGVHNDSEAEQHAHG